VFKGAKTSLIRNGLPKNYITRSRSARRRQQPAFHRATDQIIGPLDNYRYAYKYEKKFEKTQEDYMAELVARLDAPVPKENLDTKEKIIKKAETASKSVKTKKTSKKKIQKGKENVAENIQPPSQSETHAAKDRFPELTQGIKEIADQLRPSPKFLEPILNLRQRLKDWVIKEQWISRKYVPTVEIFGSTMSGLALDGSADVDVCMLTNMPFSVDYEKNYKISFHNELKGRNKVHVVESDNFPEDKLAKIFATHLRGKRMRNVLPIPYAKVPIVKFHDPVSKMNVDLSFNNPLGVFNTKLIRDYVNMDPRVSDLAFVVKYWSKLRGINDPPSGTLSSYAYVQMLLFYLQVRNTPILPSLQDLAKNKDLIKTQKDFVRVSVEGWDCTRLNARLFKEFSARNTESLGELLVGFFDYYSRHFDFKNSLISIRAARELPKSAEYSMCVQSSPGSKQQKFIAIEDPFNLTHNLGRSANKDNARLILSEFDRAYTILKHGGGLAELLELTAEE
jgi:DNA polymerase sigma